MNDLVTRLRNESDLCVNEGAEDIATLLYNAAAEIERLNAEVNDLERNYSDGLHAWRVNSRASAARIAELEAQVADYRKHDMRF